jgi:hypothetical protein
VIGAMLVAGAGAFFVTQRQAERELRAQNQALREQIEASSQRPAEGEPKQQAAAPQAADSQTRELLRLRGEVGRLRQQAKEAEDLRDRLASAALAAAQKAAPAGTTAEPASADFWPRDSWQFLGYGTPEASLQSQLYSAVHGDVDNLLASMTGDMLQSVTRDLEGKTQSEMLAKIKEETGDLESLRVLGRDVRPDDTMALTVAVRHQDKTEDVIMVMKKVGTEWKLAQVGEPPEPSATP